MTSESGSVLIGVDGGGSSCRAALMLSPDGPRHEASFGAANVSTDFDGALATIRKALSAVAAAARLPEAALAGARAHVGLAGVMNDAMAARVAAALPIRRAAVTDDRPTMLVGALGAGDGAVAAIGTGSFLARQVGGRQVLAGGWGFAIGDQASGAWLGRRLLERVMLSVDGFAPATGFSREILAEHGGDPSSIVAFSIGARPGDYARLAPRIAAAAKEDALALSLMQAGAAYIADGLTALGWRAGDPLCLMGGLGPSYVPYLPQAMQAAIAAPRGSALDGALALAARVPEARA